MAFNADDHGHQEMSKVVVGSPLGGRPWKSKK